jgi:GNAT superfamily N-acetyltransferase
MSRNPGAHILIRHANVDDSQLIHGFIKELADYEKSGEQVTATVESIASSMFGNGTHITPLIAMVDGSPAGFAVYFYNYSTWQGKKGLYLEDLYVTPKYRGFGVGKRLLQYLAKVAVDNDCGRFEWVVLDWNQPAIDFYLSIGAKPRSEWIRYRMDGRALIDFAESQP